VTISKVIEIKTKDFELRIDGLLLDVSMTTGDKAPPLKIERLASQGSVEGPEDINPWFIVRVLAEELAKK